MALPALPEPSVPATDPPVGQDGAPSQTTAAPRPPSFASEQLLQGHRTIEISHNGALYRLQATRQGKLILTK